MPGHTNDPGNIDGEAGVEIRFSISGEVEAEDRLNDNPDAPESMARPTAPAAVALDPVFLRRLRGRIFGLKNNSTRNPTPNFTPAPTGRSFNYEEIYGEDSYGEETFPDARVWKVYNDEAQLFDFERIESWRDAIDVLLVFIGLFAAVVSAFLIETSKTLQPDYAQITAFISFEILRSLNSSVLPHPSFSPDLLDPRFGDAAPTKNDNVVNALWYTSLTISLSTALLAMLVKQWLHQYMTSTSGTARDRARIRHFRYVGLDKYRVPFIIDLLPILLHLALALFLVGLAIYLKGLHTVMFGLVVSIAAIPYILYAASIALPILDPQCPYRSPQSSYIYRLIQFVCNTSRTFWSQTLKFKSWLSKWMLHNMGQDLDLENGATSASFVADTQWTLGEAEKRAVLRKSHQLDVDAIVSLYQTSANTNVRNVAFEAFGGIQPSNADMGAAIQIVQHNFPFAIAKYCNAAIHAQFPACGMEKQHDRLLRTLCFQTQPNPKSPDLCMQPIFRGATESREIFGSWLSPCISSFPLSDNDLLSFPALFTFASQQTFPLAVWVMLIRFATVRRPNSLVIRGLLVASLQAPLDSGDLGAVSLERAASNPKIRSLAMEYVGVSAMDRNSLALCALASLSALMSEENVVELQIAGRGLSSLLPPSTPTNSAVTPLFSIILGPLFDCLRPLDDPNPSGKGLPFSAQHETTLRTLFTNFFSSPHTEQISWKTIHSAVNAWLPPFFPSNQFHVITTPNMVHCALRQLHRPPTDIHDYMWMHDTPFIITQLISSCTSVRSPELSEALFSTLRQLDVFPVDTSTQGIFYVSLWSLYTSRIIDTICEYHLGESEQEKWSEEWMTYLHDFGRLKRLCTTLLAVDAECLHRFCQIRPTDPNWAAIFPALLELFEDEAFLDTMSESRNQVLWPRRQLSDTLIQMKTTFSKHHPLLLTPEYDIPQFDEYDNPLFELVKPSSRVDSNHDYAGTFIMQSELAQVGISDGLSGVESPV